MLRNDKIEWIWNYVTNGFGKTDSEFDYETLSNEKEEVLDEIIEEICEYEEWDLEVITK